jgi:hypothetical protein
MRHIFILTLALSFQTAFSQNCDKFSANYIPKDLNDALAFLNCSWSDKDKEEFKNRNENDLLTDFHFGKGLDMRNDWELWKGKNSLSKYFKARGIFHPDDMSSIVLHSFHRTLNNRDIDLDNQIKYYKDYWDAAEKEYGEKSKHLTEESKKEYAQYNIGDSVRVAFTVHEHRNNVHVYTVHKHPDIDEKPDCMVKGVVKNKRIAKNDQYLLTLLITDICGHKEAHWSGRKLRVGQQYDFFNLKNHKIYRD